MIPAPEGNYLSQLPSLSLPAVSDYIAWLDLIWKMQYSRPPRPRRRLRRLSMNTYKGIRGINCRSDISPRGFSYSCPDAPDFRRRRRNSPSCIFCHPGRDHCDGRGVGNPGPDGKPITKGLGVSGHLPWIITRVHSLIPASRVILKLGSAAIRSSMVLQPPADRTDRKFGIIVV